MLAMRQWGTWSQVHVPYCLLVQSGWKMENVPDSNSTSSNSSHHSVSGSLLFGHWAEHFWVKCLLALFPLISPTALQGRC